MDWRSDICTAREACEHFDIGQATFSKVVGVMRVRAVGLVRIDSKRPTMLWRTEDVAKALAAYRERASQVRAHNFSLTMRARLQNHYRMKAQGPRSKHWTQE